MFHAKSIKLFRDNFTPAHSILCMNLPMAALTALQALRDKGNIQAVNGSYPLLACKRILNPKGTYVMVGGAFSQIFKAILFGWVLSLGAKKIRFLTAKLKQIDLEFIVTLVSEGKIKPVIDKYYPLDKTAEAFRYLGKGHARGKVIINVQ